MRKLNLLNQRFGRLSVVEQSEPKNGNTMWKCKCDCGNITIVSTINLRANRIKSCGCLKLDNLIKRNVTHNQRHTPLYDVWKSLKQRCYNPKNNSYHNYGARGIKVCDEWINNFQTFYDWAYANGYSTENQEDEVKKLTLDRIDVNGNYEPNNCRWVTRKTQANNLRTNRNITINGETKSIAEWCRFFNISRWTYNTRIQSGLTPQVALTKPIQFHKKKKDLFIT